MKKFSLLSVLLFLVVFSTGSFAEVPWDEGGFCSNLNENYKVKSEKINCGKISSVYINVGVLRKVYFNSKKVGSTIYASVKQDLLLSKYAQEKFSYFIDKKRISFDEIKILNAIVDGKYYYPEKNFMILNLELRVVSNGKAKNGVIIARTNNTYSYGDEKEDAFGEEIFFKFYEEKSLDEDLKIVIDSAIEDFTSLL